MNDAQDNVFHSSVCVLGNYSEAKIIEGKKKCNRLFGNLNAK